MVVTLTTTGSPTSVKLSEVVAPWPRQREFLRATRAYEYTLFGGAAGPGKSYILRWWLVALVIRWFRTLGLRGVRVGLFCEDYPALDDRHLSKVRAEFPEWLGRLNEQHHEFRLWPEYGGGVVAFRNLDRPSKYQSVEFAAIGVDELTMNPRETFDILRARKRWPGIDFSPFAATTNPGGIGHVWVKKLWVDKDFSGDDSRLNPDAFQFIPARAGDNPALPSSYLETLSSLPEKLRKAFLDGDWNIFVGQFFTEWSEAKHVCDPFAIPASWPRWCGIDYGYAKPFCCLWLTRAPDGTIFIYRELYAPGLTDAAQAQAILQYSQGERILWRYADPSMWSAQPNGVSIASVYDLHGCPLVPANNDRRAGWLRVREVLKDQPDSGKPRLQVFRTCANLIRTLPGLVHDRIDVEDVDTEGDDHASDAARYALMGEAQPAATIQRARFG